MTAQQHLRLKQAVLRRCCVRACWPAACLLFIQGAAAGTTGTSGRAAAPAAGSMSGGKGAAAEGGAKGGGWNQLLSFLAQGTAPDSALKPAGGAAGPLQVPGAKAPSHR